MGRYQFELLIDAPRERVFEAWTDLGLMREWVGGVTDVTDVSGPVTQPGTTYVLSFGRMRSRVEILEVDPPRHFRSRGANWILKLDNDAVFQEEGGGTRMRQTLVTKGLVSALFARIFATGSFKGSFRGELNEFKRLVESADRH